MTFATLSSKGQLTVPVAAREALGLRAGSRVSIETQGDRIIIRPPPDFLTFKGMLGKAKPRVREQAALASAAAKRARGAA